MTSACKPHALLRRLATQSLAVAALAISVVSLSGCGHTSAGHPVLLTHRPQQVLTSDVTTTEMLSMLSDRSVPSRSEAASSN